MTTETMLQKIEGLEKQRKELSKEIRHLKTIVYRRKYYKQHTFTNSLVWEMFGKKVKDLTPEELREYNNARDRKRREKKKEMEK